MSSCHVFFIMMDTASFTCHPASWDHPFSPLYRRPGPDAAITSAGDGHSTQVGAGAQYIFSPLWVFHAGNDKGKHSF